MKLDTTIGARIRSLRINKKQTLQCVANAAGVTKAHICALEQGSTKNPSMSILLGLARNFGVSVGYIMGEQPNQDETELAIVHSGLQCLDSDDLKTIRMLVQRMLEKKAAAHLAALVKEASMDASG